MTATPIEYCHIKHPREYRKLMETFWEAYNSELRSDSMLELVDQILDFCEGHYTVWLFRRNVLMDLGMDLRAELDWARNFSSNQPKNYQVWHHRAWLIENLSDPLDELSVTISDFQREPKNYHAWQYRQWLIKQFPEKVNFQEEKMFVDELIRIDMHNNSAWNHRRFCYEVLGKDDRTCWVEEEVAFAREKLSVDPLNESALQYLNWLDTKI